MEKWQIVDDIEEMQKTVTKMGFFGRSVNELFARDLIADYIVKKINNKLC